MAASYDFVQLDVFTRKSLAGNPLAIFTRGSWVEPDLKSFSQAVDTDQLGSASEKEL
jgi:predicted PhzF superfamily epimerase YddE/YHI9